MLPKGFPPPPPGKNGYPWTSGTVSPKYDGKDLPVITIVTPSYMQGQFLEETIRSVLLQNYPQLEYFIMDGGSTDCSVDIIKKYEKWIDGWVSEPDGGQPQAINKGLKKARGDIFNWVNSDDLLTPGALWEVASAFRRQPSAESICWRYTAFNEKKQIPKLRMKVFDELEKTLVFGYVSPCCMFWKMKTVRDMNGFDEGLQYVFDLEFWWRFLEKGGLHRFLFMEKNLAFFRLHPASKTMGNLKDEFMERQQLQKSILETYAPHHPWLAWLHQVTPLSNYSHQWHFPTLISNSFSRYSQADMLMCFPLHFSFKLFYQTYLRCLLTASFPSFQAAFSSPFRRVSRKYFLTLKSRFSRFHF